MKNRKHPFPPVAAGPTLCVAPAVWQIVSFQTPCDRKIHRAGCECQTGRFVVWHGTSSLEGPSWQRKKTHSNWRFQLGRFQLERGVPGRNASEQDRNM